jgi:V/A-type H+/Na+-transporting ATPase subunit E
MAEKERDMNLDALVSKLQTEGVDRAKARGAEIVQQATEDAEAILTQARDEAKSLLDKARSEAEQYQQNAVSAIELAGRDMVLSLKARVKELFDRAFLTRIGAELEDEQLLKDLISTLVNTWTKEKTVEIQVGEKKTEQLQRIIQAAVKEEFREAVELRTNKNVTQGFRLFLKDDEVNYDFSDETIGEALKANLNPGIAELMK